jgi:hydrogenase maturation protein HypF
MIGAPAVIDWEPLVHGIIADILGGRTPARIAAKFHNTLVEMMVRVAVLGGEEKVALSGGCFQNRYLTERAVRRLRHEGFKVYWHQRVPTNDGGIALGQAAAAAAAAADKEKPKKGRLSLCV